MDNEEDVQEQKYIPTSPISDFSGYHELTQQDLAKIHANSSSGSKMVKSADSDSDLEILGEEGISTPSKAKFVTRPFVAVLPYLTLFPMILLLAPFGLIQTSLNVFVFLQSKILGSNTSRTDVVANIRSQFAHSSNYEAPERKRGNLGHKHSPAQIKILEARFQQIRAEEKRDGRKVKVKFFNTERANCNIG